MINRSVPMIRRQARVRQANVSALPAGKGRDLPAQRGQSSGVARTGRTPVAVIASARDYLALTKPGIIQLLLITTLPAMILAADGWPGLDLIALTLLGGVLTAGGANAMNQWYDRDIDALMARTAQRPIPSGRVRPGRALAWGLLLAAAGGAQLALTVNLLAAGWALAAVGFYVLVYTIWLKRSTPHNIVIGGAAGAVPPLVGWAAVRGTVDLEPLLLFLIVFLWTPPHFWALALRYRDDYARARVPMLPVLRGEAGTTRQILNYTVVLVAASVLPTIAGESRWLYLGVALALGAGFLLLAERVRRGLTAPMRLFAYSIVYLTAIFVAVAADALIF